MPYANAKDRPKRGLCVCCPLPVEEGKTRCFTHGEKDRIKARKNMKLLRVRRKKEGKCTNCGRELNPDIDENNSSCKSCSQVKLQLQQIKGRRDRR